MLRQLMVRKTQPGRESRAPDVIGGLIKVIDGAQFATSFSGYGYTGTFVV